MRSLTCSHSWPLTRRLSTVARTSCSAPQTPMLSKSHTCFPFKGSFHHQRCLIALLLCLLSGGLWLKAADDEDANGGSVRRHEVVRIGSDAQVATNESVSVVTVINGNAQIDGDVRGEVVVIGGNLKVNGRIRGTVVVILGNLEAGPTALLNRQAVVIGGEIHKQDGARLRPDNHVISTHNSPVLGGLFDWVVQGALWLRPLPPRVLWVWTVPLTFFLFYLFLGLILPGPTSASVRALTDRPIVSYMVGLIALVFLLLLSPVLIILGVAGAGIFLIVAVALVLVFGRMVVVQFVGLQATRQFQAPILHQPLMGLFVGSALFCLMYMIPVLGLTMWIGTFPLALGGILVAAARGMRPRRVPPQMPPNSASAATNPNVEAAPQTSGQTLAPIAPAMLQGRPVCFFMRGVATLIDLILISLINHLLDLHGRSWLLVWMAYHIVLWTWTGATLGGRVLGMRLAGPDGRGVDFKVATTRCLAAFLSALPLGLGFVWSAWDVRKQSWHDKLTGTRIEWVR